MSAKCPKTNVLQALSDASGEGQQTAGVRAHVASCERCQEALADLRTLGAALGEMARAERAAASVDLWPGIAARLRQPGFVQRLPLPFAAAWRQATLLLRPAVAASAVAGLAGLFLGGWMAYVAVRGPADAEAEEPYPTSSLVVEPENGLTETYLQAVEPAAVQAGDSSAVGGALFDTTGGVAPEGAHDTISTGANGGAP